MFLNICGFETGDLSEVASSSGTVSVISATKRTGGYALSCTGSGNVVIQKLAADGTSVSLNTATRIYLAGHFYLPLLPSADASVFFEVVTGGGAEVYASLDISGAFKLIGTTTSATIATLSAGQWYRLELSVITGGTCYAKINSGTEQSVTGKNRGNITGWRLEGVDTTRDVYWDDIAISDSAYPGAGEVRILKPNGTGNYTSWTDGAGTAPTNVAEVPHDSDTSYIASSVSLDVETEAMDSATTGGVTGTIGTVKSIGIVRAVTAGADTTLRLRSATTDDDSGATAPSTSYSARAKLYDTDPATTAAWTSSGIDGIEVGGKQIFGGLEVRFTALYAMVWCTGVVAGGPFSFVSVAGGRPRPLAPGARIVLNEPLPQLSGQDTIYPGPGLGRSFTVSRGAPRPQLAPTARVNANHPLPILRGQDTVYLAPGLSRSFTVSRGAPRPQLAPTARVNANHPLPILRGQDTVYLAPGLSRSFSVRAPLPVRAGTATQTWFLPLNLPSGPSQTVAFDAALAQRTLTTTTFDAALGLLTLTSVTYDANLVPIVTKTLTFDATLGTRVLKTVTLDAALGLTTTKTATYDAAMGVVATLTATYDASLALRTLQTATYDALLSAPLLKTLTLDALLTSPVTKTLTLDALFTSSLLAALTWDALLYVLQHAPGPASGSGRVTDRLPGGSARASGSTVRPPGGSGRGVGR